MSRVGVQRPTIPSLRDVRDSVLSILLTKSTQAATPAPASSYVPPSRSPRMSNITWSSPSPPPPYTPYHYSFSSTTPHQSIRPCHKYSHHQQQSFYPEESDVQLAELTADLLSATDAEKKQGRVIRQLAQSLKRAEKQIALLQGSNGKLLTRSEAKVIQRRMKEMENRVRDVKRRNTLLEKEAAEAEREARRLQELLTDLRISTRRMLEERERHVETIGALEQQVATLRNAQQNVGRHAGPESSPAIVRRSRQFRETNQLYYDEDASPRKHPRHNTADSCHVTIAPISRPLSPPKSRYQSAHPSRSQSRSQSPPPRSIHHDVTPAQVERQLVAEIALEAAREELSKLRSHNEELERKLAQNQAVQLVQEGQDKSMSAMVDCYDIVFDKREQDVLEALAELNDEVQVLAGISDCVDWTREAPGPRECENTVALMQGIAGYKETREKLNCDCPEVVVRNITDTVISVRKAIASKYGEWLSNVTGAGASETMSDDMGSANVDTDGSHPVPETILRDDQGVDVETGQDGDGSSL